MQIKDAENQINITFSLFMHLIKLKDSLNATLFNTIDIETIKNYHKNINIYV